MGHQDQSRPDQALARLATRQHGVVSARQMHEIGFSPRMIHSRSRAGRLHRLYRGVYAVGHRKLTDRSRWLAAVLASGPGALLSHGAVLAHRGLRPRRAGPIDITVAGKGRRALPGIRLHCVRSLDPGDRTILDAIPITTIARTLLDYPEVAERQELRLALEAADRRELLDLRAIEALIARSSGRHGIPALREGIEALIGSPPWTRSEFERQFLALVRRYELEEPQTNVSIEGELVDACWPRHRLIAELDGYLWHRGRASFESDRARDAKHLLAGWRTLRLTQRRIENQPERIAREVASLTRGDGRRP